MFFDRIEKLKREYTDRYVVVKDEVPELRRFAGWSGRVKTVNMSGKALVEFGKLENIGYTKDQSERPDVLALLSKVSLARQKTEEQLGIPKALSPLSREEEVICHSKCINY